MLVFLVLFISVLVQFSAAVCAFRLIKVTGKTYAWVLISMALFLMGVRRLIPLYHAFSSTTGYTIDLTNEWIGLVLSLLMLLGMMRIGPLLAERMTAKERSRPVAAGPDMEPTGRPQLRPRFSKFINVPLLIFLMLAVTIAAVGYRHLRRQMEMSRLAAQDELTAIGMLKSKQIATWHEEVVEDAWVMQAVPGIAEWVQNLAENPSRQDARTRLLAMMAAIKKRPAFESIQLLDRKQEVLLAIPEEKTPADQAAKLFAEQAMRTGNVLVVDLHQHGGAGNPADMDTYIPLLAEPKADEHSVDAVGVLLVRINPEVSLFPIVQSWPTKSETAETLLVRREGNEVVFLNRLRFSPAAPLTLRQSIDPRVRRPAAMAVTGYVGLVEAKDYRDVPVLAYACAIPGTPWSIIAKMDRREIDAPLRRQAAQTGVAGLLLILSAGLAVGIVWRQHDSRRLKAQLAAERGRSESEARYRAQFEQAGDYFMVFEINREGIPVVIDANEAALRAHGYSREELLGQPVTLLDSDVTPANTVERMDALQHEGTVVFNTRHQRKDGTIFNAEIRLTLVRLGGKTTILSAERDITERQKAESAIRESETRYRTLFEASPDGILIADIATKKIKYANPAACRMLGYSEEELAKLGVADIHPKDKLDRIVAQFEAQAKGDISLAENTPCLKKDGIITYADINTMPAVIDGVPCNIGFFRDIAERKRAEESLRNAYDCIQQLISSANVMIVGLDAAGHVRAFNHAAEKTTGYTMAELTGSDWFERVVPRDRYPHVWAMFRNYERKSGAMPTAFENPILTKSGEERIISWQNSTISIPSAEISTISFGIDITERKRAEDERLFHLRFMESLDKINRAIQGARDLNQMMNDALETTHSIFDCDRAWLFYPCDPDAPSFRVPVEITKPQYPGAKVLNVDVPMPPDMAENLREALGSTDPVTYTVGTEKPINKVSSEQFGVKSMMMVALYPKSGKPWAFGLHQCSTPRIWTSEETRLFKEISCRIADGLSSLLFLRDLQMSEERYRIVADNTYDWEFWIGPDGRYIYTSPSCERITGYKAGEFETDQDLLMRIIHPDDKSQFLAHRHDSVVRRKHGNLVFRITRPDGQERWIEHECQPLFNQAGTFLGNRGINRDISERKEAEKREKLHVEKLMQSEKLASLGTLVAGVAHEINNPNMFIMLNAPVLRDIWEEALVVLEAHKVQNEELRIGTQSLAEVRKTAGKMFDNILEGSERMKNIVQELKSYVRETPEHMDESMDVNKVVHSAVTLVWNKIKGATDYFESRYAEELPRIRGNTQRIEQVVINLLTNACEAMSDKGKAIKVFTHHDAKAKTVVLQVLDEGAGMAPEVLAKIRDPFFTTKRDAGGTGLGVSIASKIVEEHGGSMVYESHTGRGTTVTLTLPAES